MVTAVTNAELAPRQMTFCPVLLLRHRMSERLSPLKLLRLAIGAVTVISPAMPPPVGVPCCSQ